MTENTYHPVHIVCPFDPGTAEFDAFDAAITTRAEQLVDNSQDDVVGILNEWESQGVAFTDGDAIVSHAVAELQNRQTRELQAYAEHLVAKLTGGPMQ